LSQPSKASIILTAFYILLAIAILVGIVWGNTYYSHNHTGETEFFVPWLTARTFLEYGDDPYGELSTQRTQVVHYGRLAEEDEDPLILWTPFPGELFYFPFALIQNYDFAHGIWMTLSEIALVIAAYLSLQLTGWKPSRPFLPIALLFPILWAFGFFDLLGSSPFPFVLLASVGSLIALRSGQDEIAGILLFFPLMMPGIFGVLLLFILWWAVANRRWGILAGLGMSFAVLLLLSFLLLPDWVMSFIRGLYWHLIHNPSPSTFSILGKLWPIVGQRISWVPTAFLIILLFVEWRDARKREFRHFFWTACLTLCVTPILGFRFGIQNITVLVLPLFLFITILGERWQGRGIWSLPGIVLLAMWIFSWIMAVAFHPTLYLLIPILLILGLFWMKWWIVRPPRTTFEVVP
jgi:Glycosyltransferase family 87